MGAAAKTAIGDEGHVFTQAFAHDGGRRGEHFPHARRALGAFIADDQHVVFDHSTVQNAFQAVFFRLKHAGIAVEG